MKKKIIISLILFIIIVSATINKNEDISYKAENDGEIEFNEYENKGII